MTEKQMRAATEMDLQAKADNGQLVNALPPEEIDRRFDTPDPKLDASRAAKYASLFIQYFGTERTVLFSHL